MPLPAAGSGLGWQFNGNGFRGELFIDSLDAQGNLEGRAAIDDPRVDRIVGFWDEDAQRLTFQRIINPADPTSIQIYTGFLWRAREPSTDEFFTLAGSFIAFRGAGGDARRSVYGWTASIGIPG